MKVEKLIILIGVIVMIFSAQTGCAMHIPPYNAVIRNVGANEVSNVRVTWGEYDLSVGGWLIPKQHKIQLKPDVPIPETATVMWKRDKMPFNKVIEIKNKLTAISNKEQYYLIIDIDDNNNVDFRVISCSDDENCLNKW
jgi:hypothetical protein